MLSCCYLWPQTTYTKNVKFGHVVFEICKWTERQPGILISHHNTLQLFWGQSDYLYQRAYVFTFFYCHNFRTTRVVFKIISELSVKFVPSVL